MDDVPEDKPITFVVKGVDPAARYLWNALKDTYSESPGELMSQMLRDKAKETFGPGAEHLERRYYMPDRSKDSSHDPEPT